MLFPAFSVVDAFDVKQVATEILELQRQEWDAIRYCRRAIGQNAVEQRAAGVLRIGALRHPRFERLLATYDQGGPE